MAIFDYIIIGGGIIGMSTAHELAKRGANVALFERGQLGMEASWAAGGILSSMRPWSENPASAELSEQGKLLYPEYTKSLMEDTGIDPEYIESGLVVIEQKHINDITEWARTRCIKIQQNDHAQGADIILPEQAVLLPEIAQLHPPRLLKALCKSLEQLSVAIYENTKITDVVTKNDRFDYVKFTGGKLSAESIIITAGAWSKSILGNGFELGVKPVHGQMICVKPVKPLLQQIVLDDGHYFIPRRDGHLLIGSTMENIGYSKIKTPAAREELLNWAYCIWPDLVSAKFVKHWSGLRPATNIEKPFIGSLLNFKNIYLNTGHFRKGILQAPASAKLLVDTLAGNKSFMEISKFSAVQPEPISA